MRNLKKLLALSIVLALSVSFMLPAFARDLSDFPDADATAAYLAAKGNLADVYANAAQLMVDLGVVQGHTGTTADRGIDLAGTLTRAQFAALLYRAVTGNAEPPTFLINATPFFGDTKSSDWYAPYTTWIGETGISTGMGYTVNGKPAFEPDTPIDFSMAALLCMRAIGFRDDRENFTYSEAGALLQAWTNKNENWPGGDLLAGVSGMENNLVDRGNAFVLIYNTIFAEMFGYGSLLAGASITGWERDYQNKNLLEVAFKASYYEGIFVSDGTWFSLNTASANITDGKAKFADANAVAYTNVSATVTAPVNLRLSVDATKALGLEMEDVGRKVYFWYSTNLVNGDSPRVFGRPGYLDNQASQFGMGFSNTGWAADGTKGDTFKHDLNALVGRYNDLSNARLYINYRTDTIENLATYITGGINFYVEGGPNWALENYDFFDDSEVATHSQIGALEKAFQNAQIRVTYDNDGNIGFVFVELYNYAAFDGIARGDDGYDYVEFQEPWQTPSIGLGWGDSPFGHEERLSIVRGTEGLRSGDRVFTYQIGNKFGIRQFELTEVSGRITQRSTDNKSIFIGGTAYRSAGVPYSAPALAANLFTDFQSFDYGDGLPIDVGETYAFRLFNGGIIEVTDWPKDTRPDNTFAVVEDRNSVLAEGNTFLGVSNRYDHWVRVRLDNGERKVFQVRNANRANAALTLFGNNPVDRVYNYTLDGEDGIILTERRVPNASLTTGALNGNVTSIGSRFATDWGALNGTYITADSVLFFKVAAGNWSVHKGRNVPALRLNAPTTVDVTYILNTNDDQFNSLYVAAFIPTTLANVDGVGDVPPASWAVALGNAYDKVNPAEDRARRALDVMLSDGSVTTLYAEDDETLDNVEGHFNVFSYTLDNGLVNTAEAAAGTVNGFNFQSFNSVHATIRGINTGMLFLNHTDAGVTTPFHSSVQFFMIKGADSKKLTMAEAAALAIGNDGWNSRDVKILNVTNNNGTGIILIDMD
jgi:hypothetical protein